MIGRRALATAILTCGCVAPAAPALPDLAPRAAVASPPVPTAPMAPEAPRPLTTEVQLQGLVSRPRGAPGRVRVWASGGDCTQAGSVLYGQGETGVDRWSFAAFVPQGSRISICAALVDGKNGYRLWGRAASAPVIGRGPGQVTLGSIAIALKKGPRLTPPHP